MQTFLNARRNSLTKGRLTILVILCIVGVTSGELSYAEKSGDLMIEQPWAKPTPPGARTAAAYVAIHNMGRQADKLLSASAAIAEKVELHTHLMEDGLSKMRQIPFVDLAAGNMEAFAPGKMHIMLIGIKNPLVAGETFPMTFNFERAPSVTVDVKIEIKAMSVDHNGNHSKQ